MKKLTSLFLFISSSAIFGQSMGGISLNTPSIISASQNVPTQIQSVGSFGDLGTTNDANTFNAAFSQAGQYVIPPGNYTIANTIYITNNVQVWGYGAVLTLRTGVTGLFMVDMKDNTGIRISGLSLNGNNISNYVSLLPAPKQSGSDGYFGYIPENLYYDAQRHGFRVNMASNVVEGCSAYNFNGQCYYLRNINAGNSSLAKMSGFYNNDALNSWIGFTLNAYTNSDQAEYSHLSLINAANCAFGIRADAGNVKVSNSSFSGNGIGYISLAGNNVNHGTFIGCDFNHNTYPVWLHNVAYGELFIGNHFRVNTGPIVIADSVGVDIINNQFDVPPSLVITNARPGVITVGTVRLSGNTYFGLWANNTITNSTGYKFVIDHPNVSADNIGDMSPTYLNGDVYFNNAGGNPVLKMRGGALEQFDPAQGDDTPIYFNYVGNNSASTYFRSLDIRDGKTAQVAYFRGSDKSFTSFGNIIGAMPTNTAAVVTTLNPITYGLRYTNTTGGRQLITVWYQTTNSSTVFGQITFTNNSTTESGPLSFGYAAAGTNLGSFSTILGPNQVCTFTNSGGATAARIVSSSAKTAN